MVDVFAYYWKQIPQTTLNISDALSIFREPTRNFPEPLRLELLVIDNNASMISKSLAERRYKRRAGITFIHCQKFEMLRGCSKLRLKVHGKLKRNVIVRMHSHETRDRRVNGLKIHKTQRVSQRFKFGFQVCTKQRSSRLHRCTDTTLKLALFEISRYR